MAYEKLSLLGQKKGTPPNSISPVKKETRKEKQRHVTCECSSATNGQGY